MKEKSKTASFLILLSVIFVVLGIALQGPSHGSVEGIVNLAIFVIFFFLALVSIIAALWKGWRSPLIKRGILGFFALVAFLIAVPVTVAFLTGISADKSREERLIREAEFKGFYDNQMLVLEQSINSKETVLATLSFLDKKYQQLDVVSDAGYQNLRSYHLLYICLFIDRDLQLCTDHPGLKSNLSTITPGTISDMYRDYSVIIEQSESSFLLYLDLVELKSYTDDRDIAELIGRAAEKHYKIAFERLLSWVTRSIEIVTDHHVQTRIIKAAALMDRRLNTNYAKIAILKTTHRSCNECDKLSTEKLYLIKEILVDEPKLDYYVFIATQQLDEELQERSIEPLYVDTVRELYCYAQKHQFKNIIMELKSSSRMSSPLMDDKQYCVN